MAGTAVVATITIHVVVTDPATGDVLEEYNLAPGESTPESSVTRPEWVLTNGELDP